MVTGERTDKLVIRKVIPASREEIFAAWIDPESLREWMCPGDTVSAEATLDARVGGRFRIVMKNATRALDHTGEYLVLERPSKLVFTWISNATGHRPTLVTIELFDRGGACELVLTHERFADLDQVRNHTTGWGSILDKLAARFARGAARGNHEKGGSTMTERDGTPGKAATAHTVVSHDEWLAARMRLLAQEKDFTRLRDRLSQERRDLPWERVDKPYTFDGPNGRETLPQLFDGRSQLVVYHFMFPADWEAGCPSCSRWADNFNGIIVHLNHRDVTMVAISRAPYAKLAAYRARMGWTFKWLSSSGSDFNRDFGVSFTPEELAKKDAYYNYTRQDPAISEREGVSVFYRDSSGSVYHTYSAYARGIDMLAVDYHYLDLVPKGRDEANLPWVQEWVRRHDEYEN